LLTVKNETSTNFSQNENIKLTPDISGLKNKIKKA